MGWVDDFFPKYMQKPPRPFKHRRRGRVLDFETCRDAASHATGRKDFSRIDYSAYRMSAKKGWLEIFFPEKIVRKSEVTLDLFIETCNKLFAEGHNRISDLISYNANLYKVAKDNNWLNKVKFQSRKESMIQMGKRRRKYTVENATEVAKGYDTLYAFRTEHPTLYAWCVAKHLIETFTWMKSQRTIYTTEIIQKTIAKYSDYTTFCKENSAMYHYMARNKLLYMADCLERRVKFRDGYAMDCIYVYEFPETGCAYVGRTIELNTRDWHHRHREDDSLYRYATRNGLTIPKPKVLISNITVKDGPVLECRMIKMYSGIGWKLINVTKGGSLGGCGYQKKWTFQKLLEVAKKFEYWCDFNKAYSGAAQKIRKKNMMHLFPWLKLKCCASGTWSKMSEEDAHQYALLCNTRQEFSDRFHALYNHASKKGWVKKWFPNSLTAKRRVSRYSLDGKFICTYDSLEAAARDVGIKPGYIRTVALGMGNTAANSVWAFADADTSTLRFPGNDYAPPILKKPVRQISMNGKLVKIHNSVAEGAASVGIDPRRVSEVLVGKRASAGGYKWARG